ncbi:MAG: nuclear transport factor 2 family protein [Chloroflexota bacterium]
MRKKIGWVVGVLLLALALAPAAAAQAPSPQEVVQSYYAALAEGLVAGDFSGVLALFAEDATLTIPMLSEQPIAGTAMMQAMFGGMSTMLQGASIEVGEMTTEGDQVTVSYEITTPASETAMPATDTFVITDGKIQALTITIAPAAAPAVLPTTGATTLNQLPALLVLGGGALVALGRRLKR